MQKVTMLAVMALCSACMTAGAVNGPYTLDPEAAHQCQRHCEVLAMDVGAVVIIDNSTGCVCQPRGKTAEVGGGAAGVAGGAVFAVRRAAAQQQQARR